MAKSQNRPRVLSVTRCPVTVGPIPVEPLVILENIRNAEDVPTGTRPLTLSSNALTPNATLK